MTTRFWYRCNGCGHLYMARRDAADCPRCGRAGSLDWLREQTRKCVATLDSLPPNIRAGLTHGRDT